MGRILTKSQQISQTLTTTYRKSLWGLFCRAVHEYQLIEPGDKIAVCISGGKDSMCMAELMKLYQSYSKVPFEVVNLVMDPGYRPSVRKQIEENLETLDIHAEWTDTRIFEIAETDPKSACYLCAKMRRGALYSTAQKLGCNKIALGHHMNDVIETVVMAMFYSSKLETMLPKARSEHYEGMELIRPMYCIHENDIIAWAQDNNLQFIRCACRFTENAANDVHSSKRRETKLLIEELKKTNPDIESSIFHAVHNVQIETFPGCKMNGKHLSFLEYDFKEKNGN